MRLSLSIFILLAFAQVASAQTATPVISPAAGVYTSPQTVSITDATMGAVIHYTTDGSTPTVSSPTYSAPFVVSSTSTVRAIAVQFHIIVNPSVTSVQVGGQQQYQALSSPTNDITNSVTWSSSDTTVATINTTGFAVGIMGGGVTITASAASVPPDSSAIAGNNYTISSGAPALPFPSSLVTII